MPLLRPHLALLRSVPAAHSFHRSATCGAAHWRDGMPLKVRQRALLARNGVARQHCEHRHSFSRATYDVTALTADAYFLLRIKRGRTKAVYQQRVPSPRNMTGIRRGALELM